MRPTIILASLLLPALACASDWTRFRGPNGSGVAPESTVPSEITDQTTLWKIAVPGVGYSSPVISDNRLFLTTAEKTTRSFLCYNAETGEELWRVDREFVPYRVHRSFGNSAATTATVSGDQVFFVSGNGTTIEVESLNTADGAPLWKTTIPGFDATDHGAIASPVLVDDRILLVSADHIGSGACLAGLNPKNGETIWKVDRQNDKDNYGAPVIHVAKDGSKQALYSGMDQGFIALDPFTGKEIWKINPGFQHRSVGGITLGDGLAFGTFGSGSGGKASAAVIPGTIERPAVIAFEFNEAIPYVPNPIIEGGRMHLLLDSGMISCADSKTGKLHYDRERLIERGGKSAKWFASPVLAGDQIICCSHAGDVVMVRAGDSFKVSGRSNVGELINASPAVVGNRLYLRTEKHLMCVGAE